MKTIIIEPKDVHQGNAQLGEGFWDKADGFITNVSDTAGTAAEAFNKVKGARIAQFNIGPKKLIPLEIVATLDTLHRQSPINPPGRSRPI